MSPRRHGLINAILSTISSFFLLIIASTLAFSLQANGPIARRARTTSSSIAATSSEKGKNGSDDRRRQGLHSTGTGGVDQYRNAPTALLSKFMQSNSNHATKTKSMATIDPLADIDFDAPKQAPKLSLDLLAAVLDAELYQKEWFVTGKINPIYFDDAFQFQDPDVKLTGVEEYARGVIKIFDQSTCRAQIISSVVNTTVPNTITVTWRLSGRVNIGPKGLPIKPYICYTDFTVDEESGLIVFQEDRFDIPGWDILLSALFPFLIGKFTKEPAPEVEPRVVRMPDAIVAASKKTTIDDIFGGIFRMLKI